MSDLTLDRPTDVWNTKWSITFHSCYFLPLMFSRYFPVTIRKKKKKKQHTNKQTQNVPSNLCLITVTLNITVAKVIVFFTFFAVLLSLFAVLFQMCNSYKHCPWFSRLFPLHHLELLPLAGNLPPRAESLVASEHILF